MPGLPPSEEPAATSVAPAIAEYAILKQKVDLDIDFSHRSVRGSTEITVQPLVKTLKEVRLHYRQGRVTSIQAGGITVRDFGYEDPYRRIGRLPVNSDVHQHETLRRKLEKSMDGEPEMVIVLPPKLKVQELQIDPATALPQYDPGVTPSLQRQHTDAMAVVEAQTPLGPSVALGPQFAPIKLFIEFEVDGFRDGLHWIGFDEDARYPVVYTTTNRRPGSTSCLFPCLDDRTSRCSWEIGIRCPRTLGDAFRKPKAPENAPSRTESAVAKGNAAAPIPMVNRAPGPHTSVPIVRPPQRADEYEIDLTEEEAGLDLVVVCTGELGDDASDPDDDARHAVTFNITNPVCARHVGFAIGPFEAIDLSAFREVDEEERLGQSAVKVTGYCLPGRADEVRNTAFPVTQCVDFYGVNFGSYPFATYELIFLDDLVHDTAPLAGVSQVSTNLLFPEDIVEPLDRNTRVLIRAVADQWAGVNVIPATARDEWVTAGMAGYMTDIFMKKLAGNNAYRWHQKLAAEKVYDLDFERPSIYELGKWLHIDPSIRQFLNLKSALVLFILDKRLVKSSGSTGVIRIINRILLNTKTGTLNNGELSTADFQRTCERLGHNKLESFFRQWVFNGGCPIFYVTQRFNKKKLVVEMTITQRQLERKTKPAFAPDNFMREVKEHVQEVWCNEIQPVFTGPMTIRIHEADGTPYEHIVEIKEQTTKLEIPYNTKYKRLKRSKRQKERQIAATDGVDGVGGEGGSEALLYCLGDILDTSQEMQDWKLIEWTQQEEEQMGQESYEWIRMDADFEWIGKIHLVMPLYMYISQLQQDRDLVAQYESMQFLLGSNPHQMSLTILVRTLMDRRYFWGIREMAADGISTLARQSGAQDLCTVGMHQLEKAFAEMFCFEGSAMPRPNDFSDRISFIIQCAIPRAMAKLRDAEGKVPMVVRRFFVDKLKFNDNTSNEFSDAHYVATLMGCLADSLVASHREAPPSEQTYTFSFGDDEEAMDIDPREADTPDTEFEREAIAEIERYRRIDEWISTYQNIYSTTALGCLTKLTKAKIVKDKTPEVLQYTRASNADNVRLEAFKSLTETGVTSRMTMMRYLLHTLADDPSPSFRDRLMKIFGEALGHIALGEEPAAKVENQPAHTDGGSLVLEQEVVSELKHFDVKRKTTPDGAVKALKAALQHDEVFRKALWWAVTSPMLTLREVSMLADVAALLFDPSHSYRLALPLPKGWRCDKIGRGSLRFYQHGPYRLRPSRGLELEDWHVMQKLGLKYTGPLSVAVRRERDLAKVKALEQQIAQVERQQALKVEQQRQQQQPQPLVVPPSIAPQAPTAMSPPSIPPPPEQRPSFKLNLGKRKQSISETSREESPKVSKTSRQQTPNGGSAATSPQVKRSPSVASIKGNGQKGSSTGGTRRSSAVVKLRIGGLAGSRRVTDILARPAQPWVNGKPRGGPAVASVTPGISRQSSSSFPSADALHSPSSSTNGISGVNGTTSVNGFRPLYSPSNSLSAPSPALNLGGFRSYGAPPADFGAVSTTRQDSSETVMSPLTDVPKSVSPALSTHSPSQQTPGDGGAMAPPPTKPSMKIKLKFGAGKMAALGGGAGGAASPQ